jgi:hypothetical protein
MKKLMVFKDYTVDPNLREFRRVVHEETIETIPFDSIEGDKLLADLFEMLYEEQDESLEARLLLADLL